MKNHILLLHMCLAVVSDLYFKIFSIEFPIFDLKIHICYKLK